MVGQSWNLSGFKYDGAKPPTSANEGLIYLEGEWDSYTLGINEVVFIVWCMNIENASFAYSCGDWETVIKSAGIVPPTPGKVLSTALESKRSSME